MSTMVVLFFRDRNCFYLQCFASGAEIGPHKNDHAYKFYVSTLICNNLIKFIYLCSICFYSIFKFVTLKKNF